MSNIPKIFKKLTDTTKNFFDELSCRDDKSTKLEKILNSKSQYWRDSKGKIYTSDTIPKDKNDAYAPVIVVKLLNFEDGYWTDLENNKITKLVGTKEEVQHAKIIIENKDREIDYIKDSNNKNYKDNNSILKLQLKRNVTISIHTKNKNYIAKLVVDKLGNSIFYYDDKTHKNDNNLIVLNISLDHGCNWDNFKDKIKTVSFDSSFKKAHIISCNRWFSNCKNLINIDFTNLDLSNVKDMTGMFKNCTSLHEINLSVLNINQTADISQMFENCNIEKFIVGKPDNKESKTISYTGKNLYSQKPKNYVPTKNRKKNSRPYDKIPEKHDTNNHKRDTYSLQKNQLNSREIRIINNIKQNYFSDITVNKYFKNKKELLTTLNQLLISSKRYSVFHDNMNNFIITTDKGKVDVCAPTKNKHLEIRKKIKSNFQEMYNFDEYEKWQFAIIKFPMLKKYSTYKSLDMELLKLFSLWLEANILKTYSLFNEKNVIKAIICTNHFSEKYGLDIDANSHIEMLIHCEPYFIFESHLCKIMKLFCEKQFGSDIYEILLKQVKTIKEERGIKVS